MAWLLTSPARQQRSISIRRPFDIGHSGKSDAAVSTLGAAIVVNTDQMT
ncbi:hypothetical protein [Microvirga vignae]|nr:hypothetical protein [Microvirga vignae]